MECGQIILCQALKKKKKTVSGVNSQYTGFWIKLPDDEILIIVNINKAHSNSIDIKMNMLIHCGVMCMTLSLKMMDELWMRGYWMLPGQDVLQLQVLSPRL